MKISLTRTDGSDVNLQKLSQKILEKADAQQDDEALLCAQESIRFLNNLRHIPLVAALCTINQEIVRVVTMFFRAGFLLGKAVQTNQLSINVQREEDDSSSTDIQSNTTHSNSDCH
jgi:hypothetical protein